MKNEELDKINITPAIPIKSKNSECKNIGSSWTRNCPKCNRNLLYSGNCEYKRAMKNNSICRSCNTIINNKKRNSWSGENNPWYNKLRIGNQNPFYGKKHTNEVKEKIAKNTKINQTGRKRTPETRLKISSALLGKQKSQEHRQKCIVNGKCGYIEWKRKNGILKSGYNPFACQYFDVLNKTNNWNLQHARNGGEIRCNVYFLDAYDKENRIVVEYDEPHHYDVYGNLKERDVKRMKFIIDKLKCRFFRYNENTRELKQYDDNQNIG